MANTDKRDLILDNIKTAISGITTGGGYNFTAGEVERGLRHIEEVPTDKFPAAYIAGADEKRENITNKKFKSIMTVSVVLYVEYADANNIAELGRSLSKWIQDVTNAIYNDITRGGYSTFTEIEDVIDDKGVLTPYAGAEILVSCDYRAQYADGG